MHAKATFKIVSWDDEPFDEPEVGPKLTQAHVKKSFEGDLIGTGNLMYVMVHLEDGSASFSGFEMIVGSLGGRTGSFVLRHVGSYDGEKAQATMFPLPKLTTTDCLSSPSPDILPFQTYAPPPNSHKFRPCRVPGRPQPQFVCSTFFKRIPTPETNNLRHKLIPSRLSNRIASRRQPKKTNGLPQPFPQRRPSWSSAPSLP